MSPLSQEGHTYLNARWRENLTDWFAAQQERGFQFGNIALAGASSVGAFQLTHDVFSAAHQG